MADQIADANMPGEVIAEEGAGVPATGRRRMLIIAAVATFFIGAGGGAAAYFTGMLDGTLGAEDAKPAASGSAALNEPAKPIFVELPDLVVSLNTNERKSTFLKARVSVEVADAAGVAAVEQLKPRIMDYCQVYLRELRPDDLRGSAGTVRLREELRRRIAAAIAPAEVRDVLFVDLLVQ